jgi:hypothetical protein
MYFQCLASLKHWYVPPRILLLLLRLVLFFVVPLKCFVVSPFLPFTVFSEGVSKNVVSESILKETLAELKLEEDASHSFNLDFGCGSLHGLLRKILS